MTSSLSVRDTASYRVTYYPRPSAQLTIVFISAGRSAPGEPVEEFKRTLDRFDTAVVFVLDRPAHWYNHDETEQMWAELAAIARTYDRIGTIGESMGGCGAILARTNLPNVGRTLAMSPQHSIFKPFIDFDKRYEAISRQIATHRYIHFSDGPAPERCVVLFGTQDWRDYIHSTMFTVHGFTPQYIQGANHNVAAHLKSLPGNGLVRLVALFMDWSRPFTPQSVAAAFPGLLTPRGLDPVHSFAEEAALHNVSLMDILAASHATDTGTLLGPNVARHAAATQSSVSEWSTGKTPAEDAGRAVSGMISGSYAFHTACDPSPWWQVDLGGPVALQEVRLFNFLGVPEIMARNAGVSIQLSMDAEHWQTAFDRQDPAPFGGADGKPLVWRPATPTTARHLRLIVPGPTYLHLDQVQVFGHPA